ncbi:hypothetical protein GGF48_004743 [Coemansia sp. RSA 921]|nr:hypothetical protein GGF48_004743 [Coemansia sp. RSA 921]KAJ2153836.1 hypothetical protein J3F82_001669 [Coemansia sp. RSA 637]KAJ2168887.1 hypothetical protein GGH15_001021 [Coemansia sp. RSA 562]KAJ2272629.1 hypothetical protein EV176_003593 [Coemansia sp. RSA 451]KAJ2292553.1 hypothetical protein IW141_001843 [Coemansia sp. RSA 355]
MAMTEPCERFNPNCAIKPALPAGATYNTEIKSPIPYSGSLFKSDTPWPQPVASWTAGQPVTVKFQPGGAAHGGGHCQFAVSYDNGKTAAVVHKVMEHCFFNGASSGNDAQVLEYTFTLPAEVPASSKAQFIWIWTNAIGNRELYTGISDISIANSGGSTSYTGKTAIYPNHAGYDTIPEFNGDYSTGVSLYENAASVTVTSGGSYAGATTGHQRDAVSSAPVAKVTSVDYSMTQPVPYSSDVSGNSPSDVASETAQTDAPVYTALPEASETAQTGEPVYTALPAVTATPEVSSAAPTSSAPGGAETAAPTPSSSYCAETEAPVSSAPAPAPTSGPTDSGSSCSSGQAMRCATTGTGFQQCVNGSWITTQDCAPGTKCQSDGSGAAYCG